MTQAQVLLAVASLAVSLLIAFVAWRLQLGGDSRIDEAEAMALADHAGFEPAELIVDRAGYAALARDAEGRFLLLRPHGSRFVASRLTRPLDARLDHRFLTIGKVTLDLGEQAGRWAAGLRALRA